MKWLQVYLGTFVLAMAGSASFSWAVRQIWDIGRIPAVILTLGLFTFLVLALIGYLSRSIGAAQVRYRVGRLAISLFVFLGLFASAMAIANLISLFRGNDVGSLSDDAVRVTRVIDGDTIEVSIDGKLRTVRYIGVDTPETVHRSRGIEPYGREASAMNHRLVHRKFVTLEKDVSETDRYNRLLRYVYLPDGRMVNKILVKEGYARVATFPPDVRFAKTFMELERQAREKRRGLWGL